MTRAAVKREPKKAGRPSSITPKICETICEGLANGHSLRSICSGEDMPDRGTVFRWLANPENETFRNHYAWAREFSGDADADDVAHYARQAADGTIEPAAARAAIDGLKWSAGKRKPKVYGERVHTEISGPGGGPIQTQTGFDLTKLTRAERDQLRGIVRRAAGESEGDVEGA